MPALMVDTDLCITAGGSTCWELMCLGVPFMVVALAENQEGMVNNLNGFCQISILTLDILKERLTKTAFLQSNVDALGPHKIIEKIIEK